ncbi:hypothetical protein [Streptomyces sp. NPDC008122]|uniref:hypothetical protein n=1 Tax=Streptomyces sp. NPDC008122 TaxID=3364810 RepID=UPI0036F0C809
MYEPEYGKYSGRDRTLLVERFFRHSSDIALWAADFARVSGRAALATLLTASAVHCLDLFAGPDRDETCGTALCPAQFWEHHVE